MVNLTAVEKKVLEFHSLVDLAPNSNLNWSKLTKMTKLAIIGASDLQGLTFRIESTIVRSNRRWEAICKKNFRIKNKSGFLTIFFPRKCRFFVTFVHQNCSFLTWGQTLEFDKSFESSWSAPLEKWPIKWPTSGQQKVKSGLDCFFFSIKEVSTYQNEPQRPSTPSTCRPRAFEWYIKL